MTILLPRVTDLQRPPAHADEVRRQLFLSLVAAMTPVEGYEEDPAGIAGREGEQGWEPPPFHHIQHTQIGDVPWPFEVADCDEEAGMRWDLALDDPLADEEIRSADEGASAPHEPDGVDPDLIYQILPWPDRVEDPDRRVDLVWDFILDDPHPPEDVEITLDRRGIRLSTREGTEIRVTNEVTELDWDPGAGVDYDLIHRFQQVVRPPEPDLDSASVAPSGPGHLLAFLEAEGWIEVWPEARGRVASLLQAPCGIEATLLAEGGVIEFYFTEEQLTALLEIW